MFIAIGIVSALAFLLMRQEATAASCAGFGFRGADQQKPVGQLSGGERDRLHLAKLLNRRQSVAAGRADQRSRRRDAARAGGGAGGVPGCAVVISHDRWFLDRIATHILAFEGNSETVWFEGNYQEYEADCGDGRARMRG